MSPAAIAARRARSELKAGMTAASVPVTLCAGRVRQAQVEATDAPDGAGERRPSPPQRRTVLVGLAAALVMIVALGGLAMVAVRSTDARTGRVDAAPTAAATATTVPTTVPTAEPRVAAVSVARGHASIATRASYRVTVESARPCWLRVTQVESGEVLVETTLEPAQRQELDLTGTTHIRVGAANAISLMVDDQPILLPDLPAGPYDFDFTATSGS
jgi:hypothetical protein